MSAKGIGKVASVFAIMQQARHELLEMAHKNGLSTEEGKQDLLLANLLDDGKDAMKDKFNNLTLMKT